MFNILILRPEIEIEIETSPSFIIYSGSDFVHTYCFILIVHIILYKISIFPLQMDPGGLNGMKSSFNVKDLLDLPSDSQPKSLSPVVVSNPSPLAPETATPNGDPHAITVTQLENAAPLPPTVPSLQPQQAISNTDTLQSAQAQLTGNSDSTSGSAAHVTSHLQQQPNQRFLTAAPSLENISQQQQTPYSSPSSITDTLNNAAPDYSTMLTSMGGLTPHNAMFSPHPPPPPLSGMGAPPSMHHPYSQFSLMTPPASSAFGHIGGGAAGGDQVENPYTRWLQTNGTNPYPCEYRIRY